MRWDPGTEFHPHMHMGGEEILVLEGTFSDEHGDYPAGTWMRSPHASEHQPFSREGCLIYVKVGHLLPPGRVNVACEGRSEISQSQETGTRAGRHLGMRVSRLGTRDRLDNW